MLSSGELMAGVALHLLPTGTDQGLQELEMPDTKLPYSYEELSFARRIREVATSIRDQRTPRGEGEPGRIERERWLAQNPLESFFEELVSNVTSTADEIRAILSKAKS